MTDSSASAVASPAMASPAPLERMPTELLLKITSHLTTHELCDIRLTCKILEEKLFNFFAQEFFRKKQFWLNTFSLQTLIDISNHPSLSPFVKHVIIATDRPAPVLYHATFRDAITPEQYQQWISVCRDHARLKLRGGEKLLVEAFKNLSNLETVDIRDFNSGSRGVAGRDGPGACWNSYGVRSLVDSLDLHSQHNRPGFPVIQGAGSHPVYNSDSNYLTELYTIVTTALAVANARPRSVEIVLRDRRWGVQDEAFMIDAELEQSFDPLLSNLSTLHLAVAYPNCATHTTIDDLHDLTTHTRKLISKTPNLKWLRLNFQHAHNTDRFLAWLADQPVSAPQMGDYVSLPKLEQLDLGYAKINKDTLQDLMKKWPKLTALRLWKTGIFTLDDSEDRRSNLWARFFLNLSSNPRGLRELEFGFLRQTSRQADAGYPTNIPVTFPTSPPSSSKKVDTTMTAKYKGDAASKFLKELAKEVKVPLEESEDESEEDDDESMSNDSDPDDM